MKKLLWGLAVAVLLGAVVVGCTDSSTGEGEGAAEDPRSFHPGVKKYDNMQFECPVCESAAIKEEFYSDVDDEGRIYFDKKECKEKFDADPQKYLQDYTKVTDQMRKGGQRRGPQ